MASDKQRMLNKASYYINIVASAKGLCDSASGKLIRIPPEIDENWQGSSGAAMSAALVNLRMEVNRVYAALDRLEQEMRCHTQNIYDSWPEEIADELAAED